MSNVNGALRPSRSHDFFPRPIKQYIVLRIPIFRMQVLWGGLFGFECGFLWQRHSCRCIRFTEPTAVGQPSVALLTSISCTSGYFTWGCLWVACASPFPSFNDSSAHSLAVLVLFLDREKFDFKNEHGVGTDQRAWAARPIGHIRWNEKLPLGSYGHHL